MLGIIRRHNKLSRTGSNSEAAYLLGTMYEEGKGTVRDESKAADLYEQAIVNDGHVKSLERLRVLAEKGNPIAQFRMGNVYGKQLGVRVLPLDVNEQEKWYRLSAAQGNTSAQYWLGVLYEADGKYADAATYYLAASNKNFPWAQVAFAMLLIDGKGVQQNVEEALRLLRNATQSANIFATSQWLAEANEAYEQKQYVKARIFFLALEELYPKECAYWLGVIYENGQGVPQDIFEAMRWYRESAALGDKRARAHLPE